MAKRGLNSQQIFEAAVKLVQEKGYDSFSVRELAARLEVKPASLYNHIQGLDEVYTAIALASADKLKKMLSHAVSGQSSDDAFLAGTLAYRQFALEHTELYKAFVRMPLLNDKAVLHVAYQSFQPLREIITGYGLSKRDTLNFIRGLRSVMHGFIELTNNGFMHKEEVTQEESYEEIMRNFLHFLKTNSNQEECSSEKKT